jgi:hypothetical protein
MAGNIVVFLLKDFNGAIRLASRRGNIDVLPGVAKLSQPAKIEDHKTLLVMGNNQVSVDFGQISCADYCDMYSRSGSITLGLSHQVLVA